MLEAIKRFYAERIQPADQSKEDQQHRLQLATAALLIEMAQEDNQRHSMEFQAIHEGIRQVFRLSDDETAELIELADREAHEATDHFEFTNLINEHFDYQQKCQVVELLWRVCLSDADMDRYEEQLVRKIAGLLFVEHRDYIAAKLRVQHDYSSSYMGGYEDYQ
ncbi:TerB family tellurite resistance protein [Arhodomonas sp. AD133]|uniref:tellurite resistance TerB family protein n=1 Tax=Arhodomonas sp. AD133 TaxID=3415009 RepID=UPI003EB6E932